MSLFSRSRCPSLSERTIDSPSATFLHVSNYLICLKDRVRKHNGTIHISSRALSCARMPSSVFSQSEYICFQVVLCLMTNSLYTPHVHYSTLPGRTACRNKTAVPHYRGSSRLASAMTRSGQIMNRSEQFLHMLSELTTNSGSAGHMYHHDCARTPTSSPPTFIGSVFDCKTIQPAIAGLSLSLSLSQSRNMLVEARLFNYSSEARGRRDVHVLSRGSL